MYYLSKRDNVTKIKVDESYSNENNVMIEYLNGPKQGKAVTITHSTLKRWWRRTEENNEIISQKSVENTVVPSDVSVVKPSDKKSVKIKRTTNCLYEDKIIKLCAYLKELKTKFYESNNCYKIMNHNNKPLAEVYPQKKKIVCYFKTLEGLDLTDTLFYKDGYKYYLPARVDISYDIDFIAKINLMIQSKED